MDILHSFFRGICIKPHAYLISINGNIKECLAWIEGFWQESAMFNPLKSRDRFSTMALLDGLHISWLKTPTSLKLISQAKQNIIPIKANAVDSKK